MTSQDPAANVRPPAASARLDTAGPVALAVLFAAALALTVARIARSWPIESHLGYAEGTWIAVALDAAHGLFYRALEGPAGYGGTRYFPLFFVVHAAFIRLGLNAIAAGHAAATLSVALLLGAVWRYLKAAGASAWLAACAVALVLLCQPSQMALLAIRGDALPAALALAGLAACLGDRPGRTAAVLFTLAFAAKPTSLYAPAAAVVYLWYTNRTRAAGRLAAWTTAGVAAVIVAMLVGSGGRVMGVFAASASGGGTLVSALAAPVAFARILRRVPESTFFIELAAVATLASLGRRVTLSIIAFSACLAATTTIYMSPATVENHLIDLVVLAIVVLAECAAAAPAWRRATIALTLVGGLSALSAAWWRFKTEDTIDMRSSRVDAVGAVADAAEPILFEQPMLAAEAGLSSYVLDPYVLSLRIARNPGALDHLIADVRARRFGAIVLEEPPGPAATADAFAEDGTGRFRREIAAHYRLESIVDGRPIYRPNP